MADDKLRIYGAKEHNLKDISLELPRNKLIVFCGVSGSGKSSLALDTIYAEGQMRYVESLSAYSRQLLGNLSRPAVDHIEGLCPAIAIDQRSASGNPRSTVATLTEIYDYLRVLYAKVGLPHCYRCGRPIQTQTVTQIVEELMALGEGTRLQVLAPVQVNGKAEYGKLFRDIRQRGFARVRVDGEVLDLSEPIGVDADRLHRIEIVVDRLVIKPQARSRLAESVETALAEGNQVMVAAAPGMDDLVFSTRLTCPYCGISYPELTPQLFSFNSPDGACPECAGLGVREDVVPELLIVDPDRSIVDGAVEWYGDPASPQVRHTLEGLARHYGFDLETPWRDLPPQAQNVILWGSGDEHIEFSYETRSGRRFTYKKAFEGLVPAARRRQQRKKASKQRDYQGRFYALAPCPACGGTRLRPEALGVKIGDYSIADITAMTVAQACDFFNNLQFQGSQQLIANELLKAIRTRLRFMMEVGLSYLTLDRPAPTLSGGEAQRIRLATQIGSGLAGVLYILDEPSIGLHPRDHDKLLEVLFELRDLGNTVIVIEHDASTIKAADYVVEFGPGAGTQGGHVIHAGDVRSLLANPKSLTGQYLSGKRTLPLPRYRRKPTERVLSIYGASHHNLKNIDVQIPLGLMVCVTGVSGSGKSTLVHDVLARALRRHLYRSPDKPGRHKKIEGLQYVDKVIDIDQSPIGRTPRSNPATYVGAFALIRELFAQTPMARMRGYKPGRFSFNVRGGRCEACEGDGTRRVQMYLLPDAYVPCSECGGTRYNRETLQVRYKGKNIAEVLDLTAAEALEYFSNVPKLERILRTLCDVGLDYIKLGQPAPTLSGGEAQRIKLARELAKTATGDTIYLLDEPTTGLHFADIEKLLEVLQRLVDAGNTVIVIEHNLDVIKSADYVIDLGPEGGEEGGYVVAAGTPEQVAACAASHTGRYLSQVLKSAAKR